MGEGGRGGEGQQGEPGSKDEPEEPEYSRFKLMNILGIITARGGSRGIPRKNIKLLGGKPLLAYTIEATQQSKLKKFVVSTDDAEISQCAKEFAVEVIHRPNELAKDNTPTLPVLQHVLTSISQEYDAIMILQPTSPFRTCEDINNSIELFENDPQADSLVSVMEIPHNMSPCSAMELSNGYLFNYQKNSDIILKRQDKPKCYARNGAIYISKSNLVLQKQSIIGKDCLAYIMPKERSLDIDEPYDWKLAEFLLDNS
jgi:CMP-N-acetylneuraminic acid synthetase